MCGRPDFAALLCYVTNLYLADLDQQGFPAFCHHELLPGVHVGFSE